MKRSGSSPFYKPAAKRPRVSPKKASVAKTVRATMRRMATKNTLITSNVETSVVSNGVGAITNFVDCSTITDGNTPADRTSGTVSLEKLRCRGRFFGPVAASVPMVVRMVVGYIKNQTAPGPTFPMFESSTGGGAAQTFNDVAVFQSLLMDFPLNSRDFTLLTERVFTLGTSPVDGKNIYNYDFTLPLRSRKIHYEGNTEGPGKQDLQLVVAAWCADPSNDTTLVGCEWTGCNQLWFTDKI